MEGRRRGKKKEARREGGQIMITVDIKDRNLFKENRTIRGVHKQVNFFYENDMW